MHYRPLGTTGVHISEVGLGCNRLGEEGYPDQHWVALIQRAADLGVTVFDTSERYAGSRSESMLGLALGNRDDIYIATKASPDRGGDGPVYTVQSLQAKAEASLRRLQREVIDIYQLHSPRRQEMEQSDWLEGMARLREQGKIRLRAVAVNSVADGLWLIEQGAVEVLQITYNIFETEPEAALFAAAEAHGVGLLCRMPLARGVLTGKFAPTAAIPKGNRAAMDGEKALARLAQVEELRPLADDYPGGLTRLAHHFSLTPTAVSAIIPGARTVAQLEENVAASNGVGLPAAVRAEINQMQQKWIEEIS